jgi:hypothetical protein
MLQFKLRSLFIFTAAVAVLSGVFFAPPQWPGLLAIYLVYFLLPAATAAGILFHRGYRQAFFIGMVPWILMVLFWLGVQAPWLPDPWPFNFDFFLADPVQLVHDKLVLAVPLAIALANGLVAVGIRWWAISSERRTD